MSCVAIDFGASNARVIVGKYEDGQLKIDEIYRFINRQISIGGVLYWDFPYLFEEMILGLKKAAEKYDDIQSIGIDTWGVDFGLIDDYGQLVNNPTTYRNTRLVGLENEIFEKNDIEKHYAQIGINPMSINTLFQLYYLKNRQESVLNHAKKLLFMPDLFSYFLCGDSRVEYTIASTSELLDAKTKDWAWNFIDELKLPHEIFGKIIMPGEVRGLILPEIARNLGLSENVKVMAVASHDTASAVASIDFKNKNAAFLSSGTWSLLGQLLDQPVLTPKALKDKFSNEGGANGKICFLQNITGLWILQCLVKEWEANGEKISYPDLIAEAEKNIFSVIIDVDDELFVSPKSMKEAILEFCNIHQLERPKTKSEFCYSVLNSLAQRYKVAVENLKTHSSKTIEALFIIGGGSQNKLLNRLTEEATGIPVFIGEVEATAIGNLRMQIDNL